MHSFLKVAEVADILRVSKTTVQRWCACGKLPASKIGRHWRINTNLLKKTLGASPSDTFAEGDVTALMTMLEKLP